MGGLLSACCLYLRNLKNVGRGSVTPWKQDFSNFSYLIYLCNISRTISCQISRTMKHYFQTLNIGEFLDKR